MNKGRVSRLVGLACIVAVLAGGCGDDDDEVGTAAGGDAQGTQLEGTLWLLSADAPLGVALESIGVTAQFEDGELAGQSGCNRYATSYELDGSSLTIGPNIAGTLMACPPAETAVERAYLERLPRVASYEIDGSTLLLSDDGGETILRYEVMDGAAAIEGAWTATSYHAGDVVTSVVGGVTLTAEFAGGTVNGNTGCNTFNGSYEITGTDLQIGPLASTLTACPTPERQAQEASYLAALEEAATLQVVGERLDLFRDDGTYAASFEAGAP